MTGVSTTATARHVTIQTSTWHVRLFGALEVCRESGGQLPISRLRTSKTRHLLRLLALRDGDPVRVDSLLEALWPDVEVGHARASLRTAASELRRALGPDHVRRAGDTLLLEGCVSDAVEFERVAGQALTELQRGQVGSGLQAGTAALRLYRGHLADDEPYLDVLLVARDHLRQLRMELLLAVAGACADAGRLETAIHHASLAADDEPTSERACRLLMRGYVGLGELALALRSYDRCREALDREFGVAPSPTTRQAGEDLRSRSCA